MLRLLSIACLLAVAAAQPYFYCNSSNATTIKERDFYLVTKRSTETGYPPGLTCTFNAESVTGAFFVEIQSFRVSTASLTILSSGATLFRGSSIQDHQSSITTPTKSLQVRFDAAGDYSKSSGVTLRVRVLDSNNCPPGWTYLYGNCYGTSTTNAFLNFADAQKACNSMRSNLLQFPILHSGSSIGTFVRMLPKNLRTYYTWVGLTDRTSAGQYRYYWLNGNREFATSEISCVSGGSYISCYSYERCGTIFDRSSIYAIFMDRCSDRNAFACSMPPGGTSIFYSVPDSIGTQVGPIRITIGTYWIWLVVCGCLLVIGLITVGIYSRMRHRHVSSIGGAGSVVVTAARVTVPPPRGSYPVHLQPVQYSTAPPTYDAAVRGNKGNS